MLNKIVKKLLEEEKGYGTVELLIIVAALGVLATGLMSALNISLTGSDGHGGSAATVGDKISDIIDTW